MWFEPAIMEATDQPAEPHLQLNKEFGKMPVERSEVSVVTAEHRVKLGCLIKWASDFFRAAWSFKLVNH